MQTLGIILLIINIGALAIPITGTVLLYNDNLTELIIPSEIEQTISNTLDTNQNLQLPEYVDSTYDINTRTAQARFVYTNSFDFTLFINEISADLRCTSHYFILGTANLENQVEIVKGETDEIILYFIWTQEAEDHFLTNHQNETEIEVTLFNIGLDVSGINIEVPEQMDIVVSLPHE